MQLISGSDELDQLRGTIAEITHNKWKVYTKGDKKFQELVNTDVAYMARFNLIVFHEPKIDCRLINIRNLQGLENLPESSFILISYPKTEEAIDETIFYVEKHRLIYGTKILPTFYEDNQNNERVKTPLDGNYVIGCIQISIIEHTNGSCILEQKDLLKNIDNPAELTITANYFLDLFEQEQAYREE